MSFLLTISVAIRALARNKLRASLTILGVVIGIAAVTTMVSVGTSAGQLLQTELQSFGTNFVFVQPSREKRRGVRVSSLPSLTAADAKAIATDCPTVSAVSPLVAAGAPLVRGNRNMQPAEMFGVGEDYLKIRNWQIEGGGFFSERDVNAGSSVCVIGHTIVRELFRSANPLGQNIRIKNLPFRVIGVLQKKGAALDGRDQDNVLLMPYTTAKQRLQGSQFDDVNAVFVAARSADLIADCTAEIRQLLMDRHDIKPGGKPDFEVQSANEISAFLGRITGIMTALLSAIAAISLLVGGVGIMNIMLVSVTERTREIGIRMAVGARGRDILTQFLIESVVLSCFGGIIGLALGISASLGITHLLNSLTTGTEWPVVVSIPAAVLAIIFAAVVGMVFGLYPAWQASRLDPIDALRYE
jgi:putative ABC transport system permease protein